MVNLLFVLFIILKVVMVVVMMVVNLFAFVLKVRDEINVPLEIQSKPELLGVSTEFKFARIF